MWSKPGLIKQVTTKLSVDESVDLSSSAQDQALIEASDEALMRAYAADDALAFDQLYQRYRLPLYRYMQRQLSISEDILNELYQDVWLKLINARSQYQVTASFKTFLYQIATNTIRDYFRRESVRKIMSTIEDEAQIVDMSDMPDQAMQRQWLMQQFRQALAELPADQREVFLLREEAGLTSAQIAEMMQVSVDTIKSRMRYAVQRLKEALL